MTEPHRKLFTHIRTPASGRSSETRHALSHLYLRSIIIKPVAAWSEVQRQLVGKVQCGKGVKNAARLKREVCDKCFHFLSESQQGMLVTRLEEVAGP